MDGMVMNIQRFCVQDGPGIRTTVFLKGCPLRCAWCHNPESHRLVPEILFDPAKCLQCGACAAACTKHAIAGGTHVFDRAGCAGCGRCAQNCYSDALELCGKKMSVRDVMETVARDKAFYRDGGGMTLSGGEPMLQADFSLALAKEARQQGIHVCMETCGECDPERLEEIAAEVDLFLYDVKVLDGGTHRQCTGVSNERILQNLEMLDRLGKPIILRCPVIPGINLNDEHFAAVAALAERLTNVKEVQFEPYHPLGVQKAVRLGRDQAYASDVFLAREEVQTYAARAQAHTAKPLNVQ